MLKSIVKGLIRLISWLPLTVVCGLGRGIGFIYGRVARYHRKDAFDVLKKSLPGKSRREYRRIVNGVYRNLGITLIEAVHYYLKDAAAVGAVMELEGEHHLQNALKRGKGAIVLSAHFGNFEMLSIVAIHMGYRLKLITKGIHNKLLYDLSFEIRERDGLTYLPKRNAYRACLKALHQNELVAFVLDQNMTWKEGVFVDFFGRPACTSPGLALMAAQTQAPVVPVFTYRLGKGRHITKFLPAMEPPPDRKPETIHAATQAYTKVIEDVIRETPDHWIWIHRRWRTPPLKNPRRKFHHIIDQPQPDLQ